MAASAANDTRRAEFMTVVDNRTVGDLLREARVDRNLSIPDVSDQIRLRKSYIEAIEEGRLSDLPGLTYAIGYVRTYSDHLGLDTPVLIDQFKREAADFQSQTSLNFPEPIPGSRVPTGSIIFIAFILLAASYGGWLYLSNRDRDVVELIPELPASLSGLIGGTDSGEQPAPAPAETQPAPETGASAPATGGAPAIEGAPAEDVAPAPETVPPASAVEPDESPVPVEVELVRPATVPQSSPEAATDQPAGADAGAPAETSGPPAATATPQAAPTPPASVEETPAENAAPAEAMTAAPVEEAAPQAPIAAGAENAQPAPETQTTGPADTASAAVQTETAPPANTDAITEGAAPADPVGDVAARTVAPPTGTVAADPPVSMPEPVRSEPTVIGAENTDARVLIRAITPAWVEITGQGGAVLLTQLLRTGDVYRVPNQPGIRLVTGNAGGLAFTVDGQDAPPIGPPGAVRRDVVLEPDALLSGTAGGTSGE